MKLIFCPHCTDIVALWPDEDRDCHCGKSGGRYNEDGDTATVWGDAAPIGILNQTIREAWASLSGNWPREYRELTAFFFAPDYHKITRLSEARR